MEITIKEIVERAEKIGVIGSPSSTANLTIDILGTAVNKRLVGGLSLFEYDQDGHEHYALGQIIEIEMRNVWTQDPTMRGLIRQKGRVDPITERQDTHTASMTIGSVFQKQGDQVDQSILGTVPPTGTSVKLMNEQVMDSLLRDYRDQLFALGNAYGSDIPLPMWFKHFGHGRYGAGEAYHIGIFGKTGSGKSVLAKMILSAYTRHREMSIVILESQGEFARDLNNDTELRRISESAGRRIEVYQVQDLSLSGWDLFNKILVNSGFLNRLGIFYETNRWQAAYQIEKILKDGCPEKERHRILGNAHNRTLFDNIWKSLQDPSVLSHIYSGEDGRRRVLNTIENADPEEWYSDWKKITNLFADEGRSRRSIKSLVEKIDQKENLVIIDLSGINMPDDLYWNEEIKFIVIGQFLNYIGRKAEEKYKAEELLNGLVIIDEAHRLAPRQKL